MHALVTCALAPSFGPALPAYAYLSAIVYLHFALLARPRLRPVWYRALVSMPASFAARGELPRDPVGDRGRVRRAAVRLLRSRSVIAAPRPRAELSASALEETDLTVNDVAAPRLARHDLGSGRVDRPLRLVQITDPHLGPFMSEARLHDIAARAVAAEPDLVLLTGDFLTMESHDARDALTRALSPLAALPGKVFACRGNHDLEAPETVASALAAVGATLLIDDAAVVETPAGPVQIVGVDFYFRDRAARTQAACAKHPRVDGAFRLVLLHDPGAFQHVPDGDADLVLSGHTHGGQLGLLTLGLPHTFVSAFTSIPDHGLWALGKNRLYVHRGTGHYGFPLRVGVPAEESLLRVHHVRA